MSQIDDFLGGADPEFGRASSPATAKSAIDDFLAEPSAKPSLATHAKDSAIALGTGVAQGVKMVSDAFGADNAVSQTLDEGIKWAGGFESAERRAER